jgi:predicted enzyme related to lactoylglutathione lyase
VISNSIHFEIPADDVRRAKDFYEALFGWKITQFDMPGLDMDYWGIDVSGEDDKKTTSAISGGLMKRESPDQNGILNYAVVNAELETFIEKI